MRSGKYNIPKDDSEALKFSIMPGVSSKAWRNKKKKASQRSVWDNAGYGLFFAHHLFGNLGHFMIASGSRALFLNADSFKEYECNVQGTVVSLRLDLSDEQRIRETVDSVATMAMETKKRLGVKSLDIKSIEAYLKSNSH
ncbi:hypothetical protein KBY23_13340 [Ruegeria pomeroyi]|nr:hypothetical protein [Ruegeria pomeroyi]